MFVISVIHKLKSSRKGCQVDVDKVNQLPADFANALSGTLVEELPAK
jgi:hypothetical protein